MNAAALGYDDDAPSTGVRRVSSSFGLERGADVGGAKSLGRDVAIPELAGMPVAIPISVPPPRAADPRPDGDDPEDLRRRFAPELVGEHPKLLELLELVWRIADTDCTVLIHGESGTGKELIARAIHRASGRTTRAFVPMNCGAVTETLLESELFGHTKGAFTGAHASRLGRFALAEGGTIFLDEVGEMSPALQVKLLRVLQEHEISPVGDSRSYRMDARVIAATNRDLETMVADGTFRLDLYYRMNVIQLVVPPLRERSSDIPLLVERMIIDRNQRHHRRVQGVTPEAMAHLRAYAWPGNIRELENTIERLVVLKARGYVDVDDLPLRIRQARRQNSPVSALDLPEDGIDLRDAVERFENNLIRQALERTGWNKNRAAAILSLNRTTLVEKLKKKGMLTSSTDD